MATVVQSLSGECRGVSCERQTLHKVSACWLARKREANWQLSDRRFVLRRIVYQMFSELWQGVIISRDCVSSHCDDATFLATACVSFPASPSVISWLRRSSSDQATVTRSCYNRLKPLLRKTVSMCFYYTLSLSVMQSRPNVMVMKAHTIRERRVFLL